MEHKELSEQIEREDEIVTDSKESTTPAVEKSRRKTLKEQLHFSNFLMLPLFLYGMKKQGVPFTIYAIYAVTAYSITAWLMYFAQIRARRKVRSAE